VVSDRLQKYDAVYATVVSQPPYGLFLATESDDRAFIDADYVADGAVGRDSWPKVGERLRGIVLGVANDGRVRLTGRQSDLDLVDECVDVSGAMAAWEESRKRDDAGSARRFLALPDAPAVLRWALRQPERWNLRPHVLTLLKNATPELRKRMSP